MLGTKSKSSNIIAVFLLVCTVLVPVFYIMSQYNKYYRDYSEDAQEQYDSVLNSEDFLEEFLKISFILYNTEDESNTEVFSGDYEDSFNLRNSYQEFEDIYPYLDYRVEDINKVIATQSTANTRTLNRSNLSGYAFGLVIEYDGEGNPDIQNISGDFKEKQRLAFRKLMVGTDNEWHRLIQEGEGFGLNRPSDRTYYYGMTEENLKQYLSEQYYAGVYGKAEAMSNAMLVLMLVMAALAWIYPLLPFWKLGEKKLFRAPFEAVAVVFLIGFLIMDENYLWLLNKGEGRVEVTDALLWVVFFAVTFWASACLRQIYVLGPSAYIKECTILYPSRKYIRRAWIYVKGGVTGWSKKIYRSLETIDLNEDGNRAILKIVLCNFAFLSVMCVMWYFGIMALCIYSVVLFFLLRKYYNDLREKYQVLLKATNQIADGNLEVEITEDLGVFEPFRTELFKIQKGFRKAVEEEVKSQRMKTELITNVSHDLKTPLTAIITYVNLLKEEKDEEKREDYIRVLENKSLRLKVLIEDLFEISKASSKNVTLNLVEVDVVNLFKQVKLEMEDKLHASEIEFRCSYPEGKLTALLDSQKTYRIFENLLVNISKYALPHTRAYVEIKSEGNEAVIRIMNISAAELTFSPEEITERFVRGDLARNTEGSGLGLAIVKSFTELQKGTFKIDTEADLFKVELRFDRIIKL